MLFFSLKGLTALAGVLLLFWHMRSVRRGVDSLGQWLRYLTLLYFAVLMAGASLDQWASDAPINWYNVAGLGGAALLILTMVVTIREDR